jgi:DNA-binding transcriptional regulator YdaS (Cro superfamily)
MKIDLLTEQVINRQTGGNLTYQLERGRISGFLFVTTSSFHLKDTLSIKLRHDKVEMIADSVPAGILARICDLKFGRPTKGNANTSPGDDNLLTSDVTSSFSELPVNAFYLPLGHITLANNQLEVSLKIAKAFGGAETFKIYKVEGDIATDLIYQYDISADLESTHRNVRELFLCSKGQIEGAPLGKFSFFNYDAATNKAVAKDIKIQIDAEGEYYQNDVDGMGAMTAIFGDLETAPNILLRAFADGDALPTANMHVKVTGADKDLAYLLFIKETRITSMVIASQQAAAEKAISRTAALEKASPEQAQAARAADITVRSSELVQTAATLPKSV